MLQRSKTWIVIGAAGAVVILALGWLFVIKPQASKTDSANAQATGESLTIMQNQHKLVALRKQNADLATYKAALAANKLALPSTDGIPDFLRSTQAIGVATGVTVSSISVGKPAAGGSTPASGGVLDVDVTMVAAGPTSAITAFLKQLQTGQPRAVVITVASVANLAADSTNGASESLNLSFKVFIQPAAS